MNKDGNKYTQRQKIKQGNLDNNKNSVRTIEPAIMTREKIYIHS